MATLYLTVDDAPSAALPEKVDYLASEDVPALFFAEGRKLEERFLAARSAVEAGYHLGNHAYSHTSASELDIADFRDELERTEDLIDDVYAEAGVERPAKVFRFPNGDAGGDRKAEFQAVLADMGFVPPAVATTEDPDGGVIDATAVGGAWDPGDRDWWVTLHVEDWERETAPEVAEGVDEIADRLAADAHELFIFHDHGDDVRRMRTLVERCREHGATFGDPLALVG